MNILVSNRMGDATSYLSPSLSPTQAEACEKVKALVSLVNVVGLWSPPGLGKTTVMRQLAQDLGAGYIDLAQILEFLAPLDPFAWDELLVEWLRNMIAGPEITVIDGLVDFRVNAITKRGWAPWTITLEMLFRDAERLGKRLIVSATRESPDVVPQMVFHRPDLPVVEIASFAHEDYAAIVAAILSRDAADVIDFGKVFRFASILDGHQLRALCSVVRDDDLISTETFLTALQEFVVSANVASREVEEIDFATMPGMEAIAEQLETHIVLPLTDADMAAKYDLKAKRGVLLYGPPGTGKTSVGRALAHKLQGRFFLIDGSVRTEPAYDFLRKIEAIVREAVANAPSIVFIDDADVLFDVGHVAGLERYLLTLLDGLNGVNASKVCIMMTAMDPSKVPEAILRSGRVELWLETQLPSAPVRSGIIQRWMGDKIDAFAEADYDRIGAMTDAFTPADLRRVVADAKALYVSDLVHRREQVDGSGYLERAVEDIVGSRAAMARNLADPSLRVGG